ncbi:hypothetical protein UlMin_024744 [Ulmus minor]
MENKVLLISCTVGFLGLLSAAAGFGAEATRIKTSQVKSAYPIQCVYPRSPAMALGLVVGAALNDPHRLDSDSRNYLSGNYNCFVVRPGVFAGGAILSLASVTFGILHYLSFTSAKKGSTTSGGSAPNQGGIALGKPQFPPQNI